jgi:hypothetical protein
VRPRPRHPDGCLGPVRTPDRLVAGDGCGLVRLETRKRRLRAREGRRREFGGRSTTVAWTGAGFWVYVCCSAHFLAAEATANGRVARPFRRDVTSLTRKPWPRAEQVLNNNGVSTGHELLNVEIFVGFLVPGDDYFSRYSSKLIQHC